MATISCPQCEQLQLRLEELEEIVRQQQLLIDNLKATIDDLKARLNQNATNSSIPPSANPPDAPKPVQKKKSKRKPGGQPGHPPHLKQLLPAGRVIHTEVFVPQHCENCQAQLPQDPQPDDPPPSRFQVIDLPAIIALATEYQGQARTCPCCGEVTQAPIPQAIRNHSVGPALTAILSYLTGCHGLSKRAVEEIAENVFGAPISLGTVANLEREVQTALASSHQEAIEAVRAAEVKNVDETSWKQRGCLRWLWAAATATVVAFMIHRRRSQKALEALLGEPIAGIISSDRFSAYSKVPVARRQVCWSHLKRDFQKLVDRGGVCKPFGREGLRLSKKLFHVWHLFRGSGIKREELQKRMKPIQSRLQRVLIEGSLGEDARLATFCDNLLDLWSALWRFVEVEGVEPTNNHIERLLRRGVLWRKRSFGSWSESGCRFVERMLTVVQTLRLQGRNVLDYLKEAVLAHRKGTSCPELIPSQ